MAPFLEVERRGHTQDLIAVFWTDCWVVPPAGAGTAIDQSNPAKAQVVLQADLGTEAAGRALGFGVARDSTTGLGSVGPETVCCGEGARYARDEAEQR